MPDLTKEFNKLTEQKQKESLNKKKNKYKEGIKKDEYLIEAYQILKDLNELSARLVEIRPAYLNLVRKANEKFGKNQGMSDKEREELDAYVKISLKRSMNSIVNLENVELERKKEFNKSASLNSKNLFSRWIPEEWLNSDSNSKKVEDYIGEHRTAITWFLNLRAKNVSEQIRSLQQIRLSRELERQETFSFKSTQVQKSEKGFNLPWTSASKKETSPIPPPIRAQEEEKEIDLALDKNQIQALEQENEFLLNQFESTLKGVQLAEKSLQEISSMQNTLATHIEVQAREAEKLYEDANLTQNNLELGNLSLLSATANSQQSRKFMLWFFLISSATLLFLDWHKSF